MRQSLCLSATRRVLLAQHDSAGSNTRHPRRRVVLVCGTLLTLITATLHAAESPNAPVDYLKDVKPLLTAKCVACHGSLRQKGNLRLDTAKLAMKGGDSGPAIIAGDSTKSVLIEAILGANGRTKMPIEGEPLKPEQLDLLRRWIDAGVKAPAYEPVADPRDHWAFRKPQRATPPRTPSEISNLKSQISNPIDAFIAAEQVTRGLTPLPEADKSTLLRRVFIDLIGLPPTSDELHDFLNDNEPDAYERVVDRLLESPEHARRWARHWMDIWRYSDWYGSRGGNELRNSRRHIWRWRDWIIESLAANKGYDRMIVEMLAADEIAPGDRDIGRATGFLGRNYYVFNRNVWLHDTVEFTSAAFLGLTFKCCRCHDHKYDPLAQEEYFRLRAFFEPLNVRTDQLVGKTELITGQWPAGAPPGNKLKEGDDVIFDADLAVPTYLLDRGNEKNPVTDKPLAPGVPSVLNLPLSPIEPIKLPLEAFYPDLRADRRHELIDNAKAAITHAEADVVKKQAAVEAAKKKLASALPRPAENGPANATTPFLDENFATHNKDVWKILSGDWVFEDQKLKLKTPGHFVTITTLTNHPHDFKATLKYRTLTGGSIGSVGLFFDMVELKDAQAVYTALGTGNSTVQAFHRRNGAEVYPGAGIVPATVKINEDTTLEITARGQELKIWLNGELKLTYSMPTPRQAGRFALWCHAGVAEFHSLKIVPFEASVEEFRLALRTAESEAKLAAKTIEVARAEAAAIEARVAAEVEKHVARTPTSERPDVGVRSTTASRAERLATLVKAEVEALRAEQQLGNVQFEISILKSQISNPKTEEARKAAETKLTAARAAAEAANTNAAKEDTTYTPLGPTYPNTSSGRRLALANWLTHKDNPLTARVAVNHVWKRHFGSALVPSVANFGLNGKSPTHPALLDWLATEFMESGWSLKHLHRLIVTSANYRRASSDTNPTRERGIGNNHPTRERSIEGQATTDLDPSLARRVSLQNAKLDPDNRFYWRANVRRMEAEVVRDTLWSITNGLDRSFNGPELDPAVADITPRRSLYIRITPDDQATMLELFDGPSAAECFERTDSIMPQQALSLVNSHLALTQSRLLARELSQASTGTAPTSDADFIRAAFERVLSRSPQPDELGKTETFLQRQAAALADPTKLTRTPTGLNSTVPPSADPRQRARENLVHVLLNYHEFVTIR